MRANSANPITASRAAGAGPVESIGRRSPTLDYVQDFLANLGAVVKRLANIVKIPQYLQRRLQGYRVTSADEPIGLIISGPNQDRCILARKAVSRMTRPTKR